MNWQLWFSTLFIIFINFIQIAHSFRARGNQSTITRNIEEENGPPVISESIEGTAGHLPCNITPPILDDRVALVIWYKVGHKTPIYSVDTRDSNISKGTHWSDELYRQRLSFTVERRSGTLTIKSTQQEDTGEYRCRVDFQKSPTRNSKVNLTIISPPQSIIILDSKGTTVEDYKLGPYNEGAIINITCVAVGGRPQPQVTWWHDDTLLDSSSHLLSDRRVGNILSLGKLKRKNLHMQLTCQASNNNITKPLTSTVTLDLNLRPLIVKLQGENLPLSAGNSYQLSCIVIGSRPAPTISWWKGSTPMKNTHEIINPNGNMTTSILTFTPTIEDRGKFLSCRAEQSMIPESGMEDGWKLDIYHIPIVTLELGTNSMNSTFREGIDVFFECNIKSNPWINKVSWRHNGNILENNINEGIIVANQSLVLQNISRTRAGIYTCVGSNREGDGESNPVQLDIKFAPVCRPGQRTIYSTARHEIVKIPCEIEANPLEATYIWKFNATLGETIDIPASHIALDYGRSIAHYTPMMENDYGTLLCWASNEIGDQSEPCVYTVMPAGEPDSLANCTIQNQTSTSFHIECQEGFDGGLQQDFIMEVYVNGTTRHPKIFKSRTPYFEVGGLVPGVGYNVFLVAHNSKGRSNATILQIYTLKDPEKQTVIITFKKEMRQYPYEQALSKISPATNSTQTFKKSFGKDLSLAHAPVIEDLRPFLGIIIAVVVAVVLVALLIVIVIRVRGSTGRDRNNYTHPSTVNSRHGNNGNVVVGGPLHNGQSIQDLRLGRNTYHVTNSMDSIEKNPDIIPQDDHDDDDEWTTKGHNRTYATAALAEQNAATTANSYDHLSTLYVAADQKSQVLFQQLPPHYGQLQQHAHQQHQHQQQQYGAYIQYDDRIPDSTQTSGFSQKQQQQQQHQLPQPQNQQANKTDLTLNDVATSGAQQQQQQLQQHQQQQAQPRYVPYCSATLGRQRQNEMKSAEPNIYSQIDLAQHSMYTMNSLYGTKTLTGVTMSHPSQLATFTTPPSILVHPGVNGQPPTQSLSPASIASHGVAISNSGLPQATGLLCTPISTASLLAIAPTHAQQMNLAERADSHLNLTAKGTNGEMNAVSLKLKTVPEELCQYENGDDGYKERNTATRF